jgi:hypothetical protein
MLITMHTNSRGASHHATLATSKYCKAIIIEICINMHHNVGDRTHYNREE